ncbi:MAG: hypothetical protein HDQ98_13065 [Lachnospiraceae bacterium]|nr:hypothetical protein [Lachnospiraceae bacterium]
MAKELLPEFNGDWGAGIVHGESKDIIDRSFDETNPNYPELSMITLEMEEHWDQAEDFIHQWRKEHPEVRTLPDEEYFNQEHQVLREAGLL